MDTKTSFLDKIIWFTFLTSAVLTPLLFTTVGTELFEIPKMFVVYICAVLLLIATSLKFIFQGKIQIPKSAVFYSLLVFVAIQIVSTLTSIDKFTSIFGYPTRLNGGLLSQFAYLIIFASALINLNAQKAQKLLLTMIVTAFAVALWGIPGHFGADPNCVILTGHLNATCWQKEFDPTIRIFSTLGQPNWLASFIVMMVPLALSLLLISKKDSRLVPFVIVAALILALLFTSSISGLLGLAIAISAFSLLIGTKLVKKNLKLAIAAVIFAAIVIAVSGATLRSRISEALSGQEAQKANVGTPSGQIRLIVWQGAIAAFKAKPLLGFGPETFVYSYYQFRPAAANATTEWNFYYNKAHNEFLNYLANMGLLEFGAYLIFIGTALVTLMNIAVESSLWERVKRALQNRFWRSLSTISSSSNGANDKGESSPILSNNTPVFAKAAIASILGYLATIFFGFSIVATQLFLFLEIAAVLVMGANPIKTINLNLNSLARKAFGFLTVALGLWLMIFVLRLYFADILINRARNLGRLTAYESAVNISPVANPFYLADYSDVLAVYATTQKDKELAGILAGNAISTGQKAISISPNNLLIIRKVASAVNELSTQNPIYKIKGLELAQKETALAPTDPTSFLDLARAQIGIGKVQDAIKSLEKALILKPDYTEAKTLLEDVQDKKLQSTQ